VLYADDAEVVKLRERVPGARTITFGFTKEADVRAHTVEILYGEGETPRVVGMRAKIECEGESGEFAIRGAIGAHALLPALAAVAVGRALGKPLVEILNSLKHYEPPKGRMRLIDGEKHTTIIDDTYNSSPAAAQAALETLAMMPGKRKIAVMADMLELGRHSVDEHRKLGALAAANVDLLATVGFRARDIAEGALSGGMAEGKILQYEDAASAAKELELLIKPGDVIVVKGSQSMRMERVVEEIMADPAHAEDMLVRQDAEWKRKA
jgi:UDP-N-acetylmuramyl pentapeptide synthase